MERTLYISKESCMMYLNRGYGGLCTSFAPSNVALICRQDGVLSLELHVVSPATQQT